MACIMRIDVDENFQRVLGLPRSLVRFRGYHSLKVKNSRQSVGFWQIVWFICDV